MLENTDKQNKSSSVLLSRDNYILVNFLHIFLHSYEHMLIFKIDFDQYL